MEENVNEKEEVVVDNSTPTIENNEDTSAVDSNKETKEDNSFDASLFVEASAMADSPEVAKKPEVEKDKDTVKEDTSDDFVWDYPTEAKDNKEIVTDKTKEELQEQPTTIENSFKWEDTGIEGVTSKEEFDNKIAEYKALEEKLTEYKTQNVKSDKITKLRNFVSMEDKELVKKDLEMQGFKEEKLDEALEIYDANGTMDIEAQKIRNTLNKAIRNEEHNELNRERDNEARLQKERDDSMVELKNHLEKTETMFGFKMAKDSDSLNKVRGDHYEYITSGSFLKSVTESNQNVSEAAWLWKNKDTILKAMKNQGYQKGKKEILDNIQRPEIPGTTRILDPTGKSDEFNPNSFMFGG